jgi:hypothetical protein
MSASLDTMHDKCKQVILFHNNLCKFFKALKGVLPECALILKPAIAHYKETPRVTYIANLKTLMDDHVKYISQYDEGMFTDDYRTGALFLIPELDFRQLWEVLLNADFDEDLLSGTKKNIFNHLQTIYISASMALDQIGAFNKNMEKQKRLLMNMIDNLKLGGEVKKRVEEMKKTEEEEAAKDGGALGGLGGLLGGLGNGGDFASLLGGLGGLGGLEGLAGSNMEGIASLFGEDNFVFQLAKDIVGELDMGNDELDGPMESIMSLFANDGKKIQDLIVKVGDKLEQKIASGEVDKERLFKDAQRMKEKLSTVAPGLSDIISDSSFTTPLKTHWETLSEEDKEKYADIPDILEKPMPERTEEENARCFQMPGLNIADFQTAMTSMMGGTEDKTKAKSNKTKAKSRSK